MTAALLLREFQRIAGGADSIGHMRRFALDLAIRGKLSEQQPSDEPVEELLREVRIGRSDEDLRRAGTSKLPHVLPFRLPDKWAWVRLGDIAELRRGVSFPASDKRLMPTEGFVPCLRSGNVQDSLVWDELIYIPRSAMTRDDQLVRCDDIILSIANSYALVGKCAIAVSPVREGTFGAFLAAVRVGPFSARYVHRVLCSEYSAKAFRIGSAQTTNIANITFSMIRNHLIPLPPLAEQYRIVAKVDELMALCDELEAAQTEREARRDRLRAMSLRNLVAPDEPRDGARFFLRNSPQMITKPAHVAGLREAIWDLAVRGRLVPQDSSDEPAAELLRLISESGAGPAEHGQPPYVLPAGWEWTCFGRLIAASDAGWSPKTESFPRTNDAWAVLKVSAVSWNSFRPEENKQLLPGVSPRIQFQVRQGDFLISRANTSDLVAKAVIVERTPPNLMLSDKTVRLRLVEGCAPRYLLMVNNHAPHARAYYAREASGASPSMKNVSRRVIYNLKVPLPPLAEQQRIVAKVDELMALCDELEDSLAAEQTERGRLLEALLHGALEDGLAGAASRAS